MSLPSDNTFHVQKATPVILPDDTHVVTGILEIKDGYPIIRNDEERNMLEDILTKMKGKRVIMYIADRELLEKIL